jgi:hypothetical protein
MILSTCEGNATPNRRAQVMRRHCVIAGLFVLYNVGQAYAADNSKVLYAARDVCVGVIAKFANSPDPETEITYDQGKFKVVRSKSGVTILEDNVPITQMQKFDYANYNECLKEAISGAK